MGGRDDVERPDALVDFPEEFEQRPGAPPRDLARRAKTDAAPPGSALARIEAMKRRVAELARNESDSADD